MPESTSRLSFVCVVLWLAKYKIEYWDVIYYFTVHEYVAHQQYIHDFMYSCISVGAEAVYICSTICSLCNGCNETINV